VTNFWAVVLCAASLLAQTPQAVIADPPADKAHPARMEVPDVPSHGVGLYAVFYLAAGDGPHPTLLLMHGFPGNEQNMDLAQAVRRAGWNVLVPHYRGSWGSPGDFSFEHCIEDTQAAVTFLNDPANVKKYAIDARHIVLAGHSMGGFMVADVAAHDPRVAGVALISAWDIGRDKEAVDSISDDFRENASRLKGTSAETLQQEIKRNRQAWDFIDWAPLMKGRPVLVIDSNDGLQPVNHDFAEAAKKAGDGRVTEMHLDTDHGYSDRRIALESAVVRWLEQVAGR